MLRIRDGVAWTLDAEFHCKMDTRSAAPPWRTLSEEEHARALAHLSASDEDAELLADAAFMLRELEAEDGAPVVATDDAADDGADAVADPDPPVAPPAPIEAEPAGDDPQVILDEILMRSRMSLGARVR